MFTPTAFRRKAGRINRGLDTHQPTPLTPPRVRTGPGGASRRGRGPGAEPWEAAEQIPRKVKEMKGFPAKSSMVWVRRMNQEELRDDRVEYQ